MKLSAFCFALRTAAALLSVSVSMTLQAEVITFGDLTLGPNQHFAGPINGVVGVPVEFGTLYTGEFSSGSAIFGNKYLDGDFDSWSGFAYSNETNDTTPGFMNQYSSYAGANTAPTSGGVFGVVYDVANVVGEVTIAALEQMPYFRIPAGMVATGAYLTNTTYAALSMRDGDAFTDPFGGPSGTEPDYFRVTAYGVAGQGQILKTPDFYLADYRADSAADDYIRKTWEWFDLSALAGTQTVYFDVQTSDIGPFGSNTPMYFAIDDISLAEATPEPSSALLTMVAAGVAWRVRRRKAARGARDEVADGHG